MIDALLLRVAGWGILALALTGGAVAFIHHQRELGAAPERARAVQAEAAASAVATAREDDNRVSALIQKAQDDQIKDAQKKQADALAALAASHRLQQRATALGAACTARAADAPASGASGPAAEPGPLLAVMFSRIDEAAGVLAKRADSRGSAGMSCERFGDAVGHNPPP